jgi:hypothetical protein
MLQLYTRIYETMVTEKFVKSTIAHGKFVGGYISVFDLQGL